MAGYFPIEEINAYNRTWVIKARVSNRGPTRTFNRPGGGSGSVFSVDILDQKGGEIRANFFNEAAQKFDFLKVGNVYTFTKGSAKVANKKFSTLKHGYELSFYDNSIIEEVQDDAAIQHVKMNFVSLRKLKDMTLPCHVDLCVTVLSMEPAKEIQPKGERDGKPRGPIFLRSIVIADTSEHSIECAVWDPSLNSTNLEGKVLALKNVRVNDFNGFSASCGVENVKEDFDHAQVAECVRWAEEQRNSGRTVSALSDGSGSGNGQALNVKEGTLEDLQEEAKNLQVDGVCLFNTTGYLSFVRCKNKDNQPLRLTYDACPTCNKKVDATSECLKCAKRVDAKARYMISSLKVEDRTGDVWAGAFEESGNNLLGMTAEKMASIELSPEAVTNAVQPLYYAQEYRLRMKAKVESYNGEAKTRITVNGAEPVNEREQGAKKLAALAKLYGSASADARAAVQEMLAALKTSPSAASEWQQPLAGLTAVCA